MWNWCGSNSRKFYPESKINNKQRQYSVGLTTPKKMLQHNHREANYMQAEETFPSAILFYPEKSREWNYFWLQVSTCSQEPILDQGPEWLNSAAEIKSCGH